LFHSLKVNAFPGNVDNVALDKNILQERNSIINYSFYITIRMLFPPKLIEKYITFL